jgi:2',3'-cyclic-nucleotide 2'-phosphodiesterase (5'-nucleotidase family)
MLTRLLHFCADRIDQSAKPGLLAQNPAQSQKTLNGKRLFTHPYTIKDTRVMIAGIWGVAEIQFWTDRDT